VINLETIGGARLRGLPVTLLHVRDLEDFDGSLISEFRAQAEGAGEEPYLQIWTDCQEDITRWLVVRTPLQIILAYLVSRATLRSTILNCHDQFVYFIDRAGRDGLDEVWLVDVRAIPAEYLPAANSFHRRSDVTLTGFQDVYVGGHWEAEKVAAYPRKYLQAYAFHAMFGPGGDSAPLRELGKKEYRLTRGWIFHTLFQQMSRVTPETKQGRLAALAFASPGYLRFDVDSEVAVGLRDAVGKYRANRQVIAANTRAIGLWANAREGNMTEEHVSRLISDVAARLGLRGDDILLTIPSVHNAAKALLSYVRRIRFLHARDSSGQAMLIGLPRQNMVRS
jgi:hypothetical protein